MRVLPTLIFQLRVAKLLYSTAVRNNQNLAPKLDLTKKKIVHEAGTQETPSRCNNTPYGKSKISTKESNSAASGPQNFCIQCLGGFGSDSLASTVVSHAEASAFLTWPRALH